MDRQTAPKRWLIFNLPCLPRIGLLTATIVLVSACGGGGGSSSGNEQNPTQPTPDRSISSDIKSQPSEPMAGQTVRLRYETADSVNSPLILSYNWQQLSGPSVELSDTQESTPSFTAPAVTTPTVLEFSVSITDDLDNTRDTTLRVVVKPATLVDTAPHPALPANTENSVSPGHRPTLVGVVIDSPIINIRYVTDTQSGSTNPDGQFNYQPGDIIVFKIGDIELPPVTAGPLVTLRDIAGTNSYLDPKLINMARFIQSLDSDGDPANGITISEQAHLAAAGITLDFSADDFDAQANPIIAASGGVNVELISADVAIANLDNSMMYLPLTNPVAGTYYSTATGVELLVLALLENGQYHLVASNCEGDSTPHYEKGFYSFDDATATLSFAAGVDSNTGTNCGINPPVTLTVVEGLPLRSDFGSDSIRLDGTELVNGQTWVGLKSNDDGYALPSPSGAWAVNSAVPVTGAIDSMGFFFFLYGGGYLHFNLFGDNCIQYGRYGVSVNNDPIIATVDGDTCGAPEIFLEGYYGLSIYPQTGPARELNLVSNNDDEGIDLDFNALYPSWQGSSLFGAWYRTETSFIYPGLTKQVIVFTPDGTITASADIYQTLGIEQGIFFWDSSTGNTVIDISRDDDLQFDLGLAHLYGGRNAQIVRMVPHGNLLEVTWANGSVETWIRYRPQPAPYSMNGVWQNLDPSAPVQSFLADADFYGVGITTLKSNCPAISFRTEYAYWTWDSTFNFTQGPGTISVEFDTLQDIPACGIDPATIGPAASYYGDIVTISGLGTFNRIR